MARSPTTRRPRTGSRPRPPTRRPGAGPTTGPGTPADGWQERVEHLLEQAEVFGHPETYRAGVLDTLSALGLERPGRSGD